MRGVKDTCTDYSRIEELEKDTHKDREPVPENTVRKRL